MQTNENTSWKKGYKYEAKERKEWKGYKAKGEERIER